MPTYSKMLIGLHYKQKDLYGYIFRSARMIKDVKSHGALEAFLLAMFFDLKSPCVRAVA